MPSEEIENLIQAFGSLEVIPQARHLEIAGLLDAASPELLEEIVTNRVKFLWRMASARLSRRREAGEYDEKGISEEATKVKGALDSLLSEKIEEAKKEELTSGGGDLSKKGLQYLLPGSTLYSGAFNPEPNMDGINPHFFDDELEERKIDSAVASRLAGEMSRVAKEANPGRFDNPLIEGDFWC